MKKCRECNLEYTDDKVYCSKCKKKLENLSIESNDKYMKIIKNQYFGVFLIILLLISFEFIKFLFLFDYRYMLSGLFLLIFSVTLIPLTIISFDKKDKYNSFKMPLILSVICFIVFAISGLIVYQSDQKLKNDIEKNYEQTKKIIDDNSNKEDETLNSIESNSDIDESKSNTTTTHKTYKTSTDEYRSYVNNLIKSLDVTDKFSLYSIKWSSPYVKVNYYEIGSLDAETFDNEKNKIVENIIEKMKQNKYKSGSLFETDFEYISVDFYKNYGNSDYRLKTFEQIDVYDL